MKGVLTKKLMESIIATHTGMSVQEFQSYAKMAKHSKFNRPYTELVYQPMLELLSYLRPNGFKTNVVPFRGGH